MGVAAVRWVHARGLTMVGCAVLAAAALSWPRVPFERWDYTGGVTIYPWWTWVLVAAIAAAGVVWVLAPAGAPGRRWRSGAAGVTLVLGAELAGTGIVAVRHWRPAQGMGGYPGETGTLENLAALLASAALVATAAAVAQLVADGAFGRPAPVARAVATVTMGVGIIAVVPLLLVEGSGRELTTWGAAGLIYAGPWGAAIVASAWLERPTAAIIQGTVVGCAVLAAIGPQMIDLLLADDRRFGLVALTVAVLAVAVGRRGATDP